MIGAFFRAIWAFLTSRWLWSLIGLACLALIVWMFGPLLGLGDLRPLQGETARLGVIAGLVFLWLLWAILRWRRAARANRLFVAELSAPEPAPFDPAAEGVAAVNARFQGVLDELRRRRLGGRRFLREMPWYVIIGPPAAGKTTALRQSGLDFPFDLTDDLQGVGGTRNCDWFFTEEAVLIDTAGRYVVQESAPEADAAEWLGFLDLLKKHRGRRALNGVIVAVPVDLLADGDAAIRAHGREIRKRLGELDQRLEVRLPVYLLLTKADLIRGFETSFAALTNTEREQVWGATFAPGERVDGAGVARELAALVGRLERRVGGGMENEEALADRAEVFRFPAQVSSLEAPLRTLVDTVFGESRYEASPWLRGFYLISATQEGTPIDRMVAALSSGFGLPAAPPMPSRRIERRSFFVRRLLTDVIFPEAGLATIDPGAEERRVWIWRGAAVGAAGLAVAATVGFLAAYFANRGAVASQVASFDRLRVTLAPVAARQASVTPSDLDVALDAVTEVQNARTPLPGLFARAVGPSAAPDIAAAQDTAYALALRNILEPRMVALLEAAMWRNIRDPDFLLGGLKTYRMMTGLSQFDPDFVATWWTERLPEASETPPFPTEAAAEHQLAAIARMASDETRIAPDEALAQEALAAVCSIPLSRRAYDALRSDPAATALPDWVPANFAGPNGAKVFTRRSGASLRTGIDGIFTYAGFHDVVLARVEEVAAQAALDRSVFAGGCEESAEVSVDALSADMLKLYYDDFIAQWDAMLRDLTLAPITDLRVASENLKDLANPDSALRRLLTATAAETDLARPPDAAQGDGGPPKAASKILGKLGTLGKLAKKGLKFAPTGGAAPDTSGQPVSDHFKALRGTVQEVDGAPPALDDAAAALGALSNMLQTVEASPNPEQAIKDQGGLAELTGAVVNQAALMPDPLDDWLAGIGGLRDITEKAVVDQLNAAWRADVLPFCKAALAGRYPFDPSSAIDVNTADFARVFGPGGLIDTFTNDQLLTYVDTTARPWRWRADLGLDAGALGAIEQARRIRDGLFPGGAGPVMTFTLEPKDLSPAAARVSLNVDGQVLNYFNSATRPAPMTWPGRDGTGVVTLVFQPVDGSPEVMKSETGSWAWLRLMRNARLQPTELPEVFRLRLAAGGHYADFELRAASVDNPFDLQMFARFTCPERL